MWFFTYRRFIFVVWHKMLILNFCDLYRIFDYRIESWSSYTVRLFSCCSQDTNKNGCYVLELNWHFFVVFLGLTPLRGVLLSWEISQFQYFLSHYLPGANLFWFLGAVNSLYTLELNLGLSLFVVVTLCTVLASFSIPITCHIVVAIEGPKTSDMIPVHPCDPFPYTFETLVRVTKCGH